MEGMVNTWELSRNVVMSTKPKMLTGLRQKALEWVQGLEHTLSWTPNAPGGERAPHPFGATLRNVVSPYRSWRKTGKKAVRPTDGDAGKGVGKSERRPVVGWLRVAPDLGNITRRASGQTALRGLGTRTREEAIQKVVQMTVARSTGAPCPVRASTAL